MGQFRAQAIEEYRIQNSFQLLTDLNVAVSRGPHVVEGSSSDVTESGRTFMSVLTPQPKVYTSRRLEEMHRRLVERCGGLNKHGSHRFIDVKA